MKATYVSVWNRGTQVRTDCEFDPTTNMVTNIQQSPNEIEGTLDEEYIELPDGKEIRNFVDQFGRTFVEGQIEDDGIEFLDGKL